MPKKAEQKPLPPKHELFVREYLRDLNATQAYLRAGYQTKSADVACACASRLLASAKVRARVDMELARASVRTGITPDRVLREYARAAFANAGRIIDGDTGKISDTASEDDLAAVASIKVKTTPLGEGDTMVEREVRMHDKIKALDALGNHLGLFRNDGAIRTEAPRIIDDVPRREGGAESGG